MAAVRKHWLTALLSVSLMLGMLGWAIFAHLFPAQVQAEPASDSRLPTPAQQQVSALDPNDYIRIQQIRRELALSADDLAAMGCDGNTTAAALSALRSWYESNKSAVTASETNLRAAQRDWREAIRRMNVGPRDDTLAASAPQLNLAVATAMDQRRQVVAGAVSVVAAHLNTVQSGAWAAARASPGLPARYRYVPDLSADQAQALSLATMKAGFAGAAQEETILSPRQKTAIQLMLDNAAQYGPAVSAAQETVLPTPLELKTGPLISPSAQPLLPLSPKVH